MLTVVLRHPTFPLGREFAGLYSRGSEGGRPTSKMACGSARVYGFQSLHDALATCDSDWDGSESDSVSVASSYGEEQCSFDAEMYMAFVQMVTSDRTDACTPTEQDMYDMAMAGMTDQDTEKADYCADDIGHWTFKRFIEGKTLTWTELRTKAEGEFWSVIAENVTGYNIDIINDGTSFLA